MSKKLKLGLLTLLSVLFALCCAAFAACGSDSSEGNKGGNNGGEKDAYDGLFSGESHDYQLSGNYTLTADDVKATEGSGDVTLKYVCTFELNGKTLDLGGYTLNVISDSTDVVKFKNGNIKNGKLNISVPKGDIEFSAVNIDETVTYELEAASETIKFSNAVISGKCTVKSNTNVNIEYSNISDITLSGNGTLTAGGGAELGAVTVSENASGAKLNIAPAATVSSVELHSAANVNVAGSVSSVKVAETAKNDTATLSISIAQTASVDKVELNAAADVSVAGSVSAVTVSETVKNDSGKLSIKVEQTAEVAKVELNAPAAVSVAGTVSSVTVSETAKSNDGKLSIKVEQTADVAKVELNAPAEIEVDGGVSNLVVSAAAEGTSVKLNETASVDTVAVSAADTKIESDENANVASVVVADSVKDTIDVSDNITVKPVEDDKIGDYITHEHAWVVAVDKRVNPTCTVAGKIVYECECGGTRYESIPALGHKYFYVVIKEPTPQESGKAQYTCVRCGHQYEGDIDKSGSITIEGLNYLSSLIPNGTYTLTTDDKNPVVYTDEYYGMTVTVNKSEIIVTVEDGLVSGTVKGSVTVMQDKNVTVEDGLVSGTVKGSVTAMQDKDVTDIGFRAIIEGNTVYVYFDYVNVDGKWYDEGQYSTFATISGLIKMLFINTGYDLDDIGDYFFKYGAYLGELDIDKESVKALIEEYIGKIETSKDADGNTVYSFDADKFNGLVDYLGENSADKVIDKVLGKGAYDAIYNLANGIADKKVLEVTVAILDFCDKYGYSEEMIFSVIQKVVTDEFGLDIDVKQFASEYYDKTVAQAVAELMGGEATADDIKNMIGEYVAMGASFCTEYTVFELIENLSGCDMNGISEMIKYYSDKVTATLTVSPEGKLVGYSAVFSDEGLQVSIVKTANDKLPVIDVNVMDVTGSLDETKDGAQAAVSLFGLDFILTASKTDAGVDVNLTASAGENECIDFNVYLNVKKDANDNLLGAEIVIDGEVNIDVLEGNEPTDDDHIFTVSGNVNAVKNDSASVDSSVWDSFKGDKELFYHISTDLWTDSSDSSPVKLTFVSDETGEYYLMTQSDYHTGYDFVKNDAATYYGTLYEERYTVKVPSYNGLPELQIMISEDCADWKIIEVMTLGIMDVEYIETFGTFTKNANGSYTAVSVDGTHTEYGGRAVDMLNGYCYYNVKTGEVARNSQHDIEYSGKLAEGSESCGDGIIVTETCSKCDYKHVYVRSDHFYDYEYTALHTQCGDETSIGIGECIVCGRENITLDIYKEHNITTTYKDIITDEEFNARLSMMGGKDSDEEAISKLEGSYVKLSSLEAMGYPVEGFYHGQLKLEHCYICGLNVYKYTYYTNTEADGCMRHEINVVEYNGNVDYEAFDFKASAIASGHYVTGSWEDVEAADIDALVKKAESITGIKVPFTPDYAQIEVFKCGGCELVASRRWYFYQGKDDTSFIVELNYRYGDDYEWGTDVKYWSCTTKTGNTDVILEKLNEYAEQFNIELPHGELLYGNYEYTVSSNGYVYDYIWDVHYNDGSTVNFDYNLWGSESGHFSAAVYFHDRCTVEHNYYNFDRNGWRFSGSHQEERHDYSEGQIKYWDNCAEDGWFTAYGCSVCGGDYYIEYEHKYIDWFGYQDIDIMGFQYVLSENGLSGIYATVSFDGLCRDCNTMIDARITLRGNWILENDVYIKAEGITIDLNGFTIDLNGYNLFVYSYAGQQLIITDNSFDTGSIEGYDPETFEDYTSKVTDSSEEKSGLLGLVVSNGDADLTVGTIAIGCEVFASDWDTRYTLFDSVLNETGHAVEILREEPPFWAQYKN